MSLEGATLERETRKSAKVLTGKWAEPSKLHVGTLYLSEEVMDLLFYLKQLMRWDGR